MAAALLALLVLATGLTAGPADPAPGRGRDAFALASEAYAEAASGALAEAARVMQAALADTSQPAARRAQWARDLGVWLERLARHGEAARAYLLAGDLEPDAWSFKAAGYAFLRAGEARAALAAFRRAAELAPADAALWQEIGYLEKRIGRPQRAADAFARAMRLLARQPAGADNARRIRAMARERMFLADRWQGALEVIWRANSPDTAPVILSERSLTQSQITARLSWAPGLRLGGPVRLFARVLAGTEGRGLLPEGRTLQAGAGISMQPLSSENLVLAVERLVAIGRFARDDWLLRAAWSRGSAWLPGIDGARPKLFWSLYLDAALIDPGDPDLLGNAQLRLARQWFWGERIIRAGAALTAFGQRDDFGTVTLIQGEPQLELIWPLAPLSGPAPLRMLVFGVSFQTKLVGSSRNNRGLAVQLGYRF